VKKLIRALLPAGLRLRVYGLRHPEYRLQQKIHGTARPALEAFLEDAARSTRFSGIMLEVGAGGRVVNRDRFSAPGLLYLRTDIVSNATVPPHLVSDLTRLPFRTASVDALVCSEVLEHIPHTHDAVAELHRVIRPGGDLLLTVPFFYPIHEAVPDEGDFWRFTPAALRHLFQDGFDLVEERRAHLFFPGDAFVVNVAMWWRRRESR